MEFNTYSVVVFRIREHDSFLEVEGVVLALRVKHFNFAQAYRTMHFGASGVRLVQIFRMYSLEGVLLPARINSSKLSGILRRTYIVLVSPHSNSIDPLSDHHHQLSCHESHPACRSTTFSRY